MVTYKSWLGKVVGQQFRSAWKRFWNKHEKAGDGGFIGHVTRKFINFPFEALQGMLISIYNKFYWLTADIINQMGCNIGDKAMDKVNETLDKAKAYAMAQVEEAKRRIETEIIEPLQARVKKINAQVDEGQSKLDELNRLIEQAKKTLNDHEGRIKQLESKAQPLTDLFKLG